MRRPKLCLITLFVSLFFVINIQAQSTSTRNDSIEVISQFNNFYYYQNFYLTGQPTLEALKWLKSHGVSKIINLRTEKEMAEYAEYAYNEKNVVQEMGFTYYLLPIDGIQGYTPENLDKFISLLNKDEKILIHCHSARRVMDFFTGYLVETQGYFLDTVKKMDKRGVLNLPIEKLLGKEIEIRIKE